jgi:TRAP transporter 4TM/12TM fusion protein
MKNMTSDLKSSELDGSDRNLVGIWAVIILGLSIMMSLYHFYTAGFGFVPGVGSRTHLFLHVTMGLVLVFLMFPIKRGLEQRSVPWYDLFIALFAAYVGWYLYANQLSPTVMRGRLSAYDLFIGISLVLLVLEATRRVVGKALVIIATVFITYYFIGRLLPPPFRHTRDSFHEFFYGMGYTLNGIFSTPIYVSATYVFIFILFGAILESTGAGKMFIDLALRAFGKYKGGPAKAAVVASGMLGSISGSSTANAVTTGTFTIPLMKKVGFKPHVAGGIEVAASSSGQLLPPVMGAAAFLMIEYTGHPYVDIIKSAAIPAILCYVAILFMVHFEASRNNISGLKKSELVSAKKTLIQQGYLIIPVVILIYFLIQGRTVANAAFFSIITLLAIAFFAHRFKEKLRSGVVIAAVLCAMAYGLHLGLGWKIEIASMLVLGSFTALLFALMQKTFKVSSAPVRFGLRELFAGFELAARNSLSVIVACATAGILIGVVSLTGLSGKLSSMIINSSASIAGITPAFFSTYADSIQIYIALILTVFACLILGLGLPTTATYVILAAMIAPALVELGLPILVAHLFVLYYGILADDTPPINLPAYATAGIAKANPVQTGIQGFKFDSGALLLPFAFATNPTILLLNPDATWIDVAWNIATATVGIIAFASFIQRWLLVNYHWAERLTALISAIVLIHGSLFTDLLGFGLLSGLLAIQWLRIRRAKNIGIPQE